MIIKKFLFSTIFLCLTFLFSSSSVIAFEISKIGVHILNISELQDAKKLVTLENDSKVLGIESEALEIKSDLESLVEYQNWSYVTIPFVFDDMTSKKQAEWQVFFDEAKKLKIIPIVRLSTEYSSEIHSWKVPNKKQIVNQINFLSKLNWPTDQRHIIIYNEVNHASEWGGFIDPVRYSSILKFASDWAHTENKNYVVLPAAMDLAAPNSLRTLEAFNYLNQMYAADPEIFSYVDVWNSHSYPNPGFISSPTSFGKTSLRGYQYELNYLKQKTGKDFKVMITETGWLATAFNSRWLESYYTYAMQHIWSDERVLAVTPFLLKGAPGPFAGFSFYDMNDIPTNQFHSFRTALGKFSKEI